MAAAPHTCLGKSTAEVQMALTMARVFWLDLELDHRLRAQDEDRANAGPVHGLQGPCEGLSPLSKNPCAICRRALRMTSGPTMLPTRAVVAAVQLPDVSDFEFESSR